MVRSMAEAIKRAAWRGRKARDRVSLCWINSDHLGQYPHEEYCPDCCASVVATLNYFDHAANPKPYLDHYFKDGDWDIPHEEDGHRFCALCHTPLYVTLTEYGALCELDEFEKFPPDNPEAWRDWYDVLIALKHIKVPDILRQLLVVTGAGR